ncbi:serine protease 58-like isoform X2 [Talpa occidentalis]|uniref:serine protease 58-like isoform X2 n=1 Tax=Talpa occidentalis TaxID=50954 RepID=UPI00188E2B4C|nr:serine protease 58-like isoform X2 [Talpa occidentalis]
MGTGRFPYDQLLEQEKNLCLVHRWASSACKNGRNGPLHVIHSKMALDTMKGNFLGGQPVGSSHPPALPGDLAGRGLETADMNHHFLAFSILAVIVTATIVSVAQGRERASLSSEVPNIKTGPTFLIFLYSENEPCLGTLIHEQWILTAAHCFLPYLEIDIASKRDYFDTVKGKFTYHLSVQHPNFTRDSAENDLTLIKLKDPLKLNDQVKLAVLPNTTDDREGETCTVSGWGWPWQITYIYPDVQIDQKVLWFSNEYCRQSHISETPVQVTENMFCAGSSLAPRHPCKEMSAAPILCQNQLYGILSWSKGCALRGDVGYYTKISHYTDWILNVIRTY